MCLQSFTWLMVFVCVCDSKKKMIFHSKKYKFSKIYLPPKNSFFDYRTHRHTHTNAYKFYRQKNASAHSSSSSTQLCARVRERKLFKPNPIFDRNFVSVLVLLLLLLSWYSVYINFTWCFLFYFTAPWLIFNDDDVDDCFFFFFGFF